MTNKFASSITSRRGFLLALPLLEGSRLLAVDPDKVVYVGGTPAGVKPGAEGSLLMTDAKMLKFTSKDGSFEIAYNSITSIEFGQKAGRRIGLAIAVTPWALLSKKRKHFLTIGYKDQQDANQGVVLELGKDLPKVTIVTLEARSGVKCEYESEEARKHVHG